VSWAETATLLWAVFAAIALIRARHPSARFLRPTASAPPGSTPRVAVIVPAHNEEAHIEATVRSLLAQDYPRLSITVVDDQSADATAARVRDLIDAIGPGGPLRLVEGRPRPAGWVGKTWALQQGAESEGQEAEWLAFIDADVTLHPASIATAVAEAAAHDADFVSLLGKPECRTFWQASVATTLVYLLGSLYPLGRVNDPRSRTALAHGAFMMIRRSWYDRVGGIGRVRGEIVEDIRFAERVKAAGGRIRVRPAPELSRTHMYGSFRDIVQGLRKNAFAGMNYRLWKYAAGTIMGLALAWTPPFTLIAGLARGETHAVLVGIGGVMGQALAVAPVVRYLGLPWGYALSVPVGITAYVAIATISVIDALRGRIVWKDRAFAATDTAGDAGRIPADPGV
jgi:hopene-associated glycosyltransferase HpnB